MIGKLLRRTAPLSAAAALALATAPLASADAIAAVGPNQYFTAQVNGPASSTGSSVIKVVCPGPVTPGELGHPVSGQTVEAFLVLPPVTVPNQLGFTGSAAHQIDVFFTPASSGTAAPVVLTAYGVVAKIPTTLLLPCGGSGVVSFVPEPGSTTARSYQVPVVYENIAV
jgi:hypothetical protein